LRFRIPDFPLGALFAAIMATFAILLAFPELAGEWLWWALTFAACIAWAIGAGLFERRRSIADSEPEKAERGGNAQQESGERIISPDAAALVNAINGQERANRAQEKREYDERRTREIVTMFIIAVTGGAIILQVSEMEKEALATRHTMKLDQRGWLGIVSITPTPPAPVIGQPLQVEIDLKNTGKTPAVHLVLVGLGQAISKGKEPDFNYDKFAKIKNGYVAPGAIARMQLNPIVDLGGKPIPITQEILTAMQRGDILATVHGRIDYLDIFGQPHWLLFCSFYMVPFNGTFGECPNHNESDDYQE
jgi:hypothetical protein